MTKAIGALLGVTGVAAGSRPHELAATVASELLAQPASQPVVHPEGLGRVPLRRQGLDEQLVARLAKGRELHERAP